MPFVSAEAARARRRSFRSPAARFPRHAIDPRSDIRAACKVALSKELDVVQIVEQRYEPRLSVALRCFSHAVETLHPGPDSEPVPVAGDRSAGPPTLQWVSRGCAARAPRMP